MNDFPENSFLDEDQNEACNAPVQSVSVAAQILELLAEAGKPQRVTDIAEILAMTKARVSRHLTTLAGRGFVAKTPNHGGYRVGPTLFRLADTAAEQCEVTSVAERYMVSLRNKITEAMLLAVPAEGDGLVVSTLGSGRPLTPKLIRGVRLTIPVSPTAWVILAFSPEHLREKVLSRRPERTPPRPESLNLDAIRGRCETISRRLYDYHPDPHDAGFSVLSAPIFNHLERLEAALTLVMIRRHRKHSAKSRCRDDLMRTALEISRAIGSVSMAERLERAM